WLLRDHPSFERRGMGLVPRQAHSPPFKGGVAAQRPGWLVICPAQRLLFSAARSYTRTRSSAHTLRHSRQISLLYSPRQLLPQGSVLRRHPACSSPTTQRTPRLDARSGSHDAPRSTPGSAFHLPAMPASLSTPKTARDFLPPPSAAAGRCLKSISR